MLAKQLVTACEKGNLPSAEAAVADGASVDGVALTPQHSFYGSPLGAAALNKHFGVVVWLLSHGADPNGYEVLWNSSCGSGSSLNILQLLIDAGGDVNKESGGRPPLFWAVSTSEDTVQMLLAQPSLDLTVTVEGKTAEQFAQDGGKPAMAALIAQEVSGTARTASYLSRLPFSCSVCAALYD